MKRPGEKKQKIMDFSQVKVNCSMIHLIMSAPKSGITPAQLDKIDKYQSKVDPLTDRQREELNKLLDKRDNTPAVSFSSKAENYLLFLYRVRRYGKQYTLKQWKLPDTMMKGLTMEKTAVNLISEAYNLELFRDKRRIKNDFLAGAVDIIDAPKIEDCTRIYEVKNCYDLTSFMKAMKAPLNKSHFLQMQGYLAITGKELGEICYCLTEHPEDVIQEQRDIIMAEMCKDGVVSDKFERYWEFVERKLRYLDIPPRQRVFSHFVKRDDSIIDQIYDRVWDARVWLRQYEEYHESVIRNRFMDAKKIRI